MQAEGSLTLAKEGPEQEAIRSANQIKEIDLVGGQPKTSGDIVLQQVTEAALVQHWSTIW